MVLKKLFKWLNHDAPIAEPQIFAAAFGKHPGWDDHIDDLGLDTEQLVTVKRLLYVQGIGGNIDSGAWDALEPADRCAGFKHAFAWTLGRQVTVLGRLWSSSDGRGRSAYPMVACAQCNGLSLAWAIEQVLPRLAKVEETCAMSNAADDVRASIRDLGTELNAAVGGTPVVADSVEPARDLLGSLANDPAMGEDHIGLVRLIYQIEREMAGYKKAVGETSSSMSRRPVHVRVPVVREPVRESLRIWVEFIRLHLHPDTPVLVLAPLEQPWVDILVGEPTPTQLFCVQAAPSKIPLTTDIPYNLDAAFVRHAEEMISQAIV